MYFSTQLKIRQKSFHTGTKFSLLHDDTLTLCLAAEVEGGGFDSVFTMNTVCVRVHS